MKEAGKIDHNIISINLYNNPTARNSSSIKFGSYDPLAILPSFNQGRPIMLDTIDNDEWALNINTFSLYTY